MEDRKTSTRRARPAAARAPTPDKPKASAAAKRARAGAEPAAAERRVWIATAAYFRAERRGFAPGGEVDDWLEAEAELSTRTPPSPRPARKTASRARKPAGSGH